MLHTPVALSSVILILSRRPGISALIQTSSSNRDILLPYRYEDIVLRNVDKEDQLILKKTFISKIEAIMESLHESTYWTDLMSIDETTSPEEVNQDLYHMADIFLGAQFTLIMLCPPAEFTEEQAWMTYGERLWTFPRPS
ncbi:hypothetical protein J3R82DRAFT_9047 [Butyriboletus roseoflavus]|nr:hypothetical protein J3R82DRAFT_9047 [Butyriboletus roseoflavus]